MAMALTRKGKGKRDQFKVEPRLKYVLLTENAQPPIRASRHSVGLDLSSAYNYTVPPQGGNVCVLTDVQMAVPEGTYGRIAPRSGLALMNYLQVGAGIISPDYRGNVGIILFNLGVEPYEIKRGDRVAQLILEKYVSAEPVRMLVLGGRDAASTALTFGSTGVTQADMRYPEDYESEEH